MTYVTGLHPCALPTLLCGLGLQRAGVPLVLLGTLPFSGTAEWVHLILGCSGRMLAWPADKEPPSLNGLGGRKLVSDPRLSDPGTHLSVSSAPFLRKLLEDMVHQGEGVTKNSQEQGRRETPERRASRSSRNFQGDDDGKSKDRFMPPPRTQSLVG